MVSKHWFWLLLIVLPGCGGYSGHTYTVQFPYGYGYSGCHLSDLSEGHGWWVSCPNGVNFSLKEE